MSEPSRLTQALPVDSFIAEIRLALERQRAAVLVAAPGAGKTTRVPPALVDHGRVLLLQPRRVAARAMARRIADERGWTVGREVGWHIRFERRFARDTRLLVVTEGILTAYLQDDPLLSDVTTVVVDEFHERSVHADIGLALVKQAWTARSDLRILVMSATLDPAPVSAFLNGCPIIDVPGALHPLTIEDAPGETVAQAVSLMLPRAGGNILCFLPGTREITAAIADCGPAARNAGYDLAPLHGSLDSAAQDAALAPEVQVPPSREARQEPASAKRETDQPASPKRETDQPASPKREADQPASPKREAHQPASPKREAHQPASPKREAHQPASPKREADQPASPKREADQPASPKREADQPASPKRETDQPASPKREADQPASPKREARRRVIVATNVAETSLTVPGVSVVIDTGLQKVARYDADRGVDSLTIERVTVDSADQRAGRAARLGPGVVRRLWDERDRLRPHREAEIHRVDLSGPLLAILSWGADPDSFEWFDRPAGDRIAAAMSLLERLDALSGGVATAIGRQMQRLPLHPRLARVVIAAGGSFEGCAAATLLSEPGGFEGTRPSTSCDLLPMLDRWSRMPPHVRQSCESLAQTARSLLGDAYRSHVDESSLRRALLAGYPDRVARRRETDRVTLATGHGAIVGRESGVHDGEWLIALDVTAGRASATTQAIIRMASRIEAEWLRPTRSELHYEIDPALGSVKAIERDWYDDVILREHPVAPADEVRARMLAAAWLEREPDEQSGRLLRRLTFAGAVVDVAALIATAAGAARRISEIALTEDQLPWDARQKVNASAPDRLKVPSGREMPLEYDAAGGVSVSVKLQELFGLGETPRLGPQRTPVTFHLLAPNGRPVQTTSDLMSFWARTYPEVRKELRGRYPRHPWPEDPWNATPTHRPKRRV